MPEGHTVHRVAAQLTELFAGKRPQIDSPQGRFAPQAALLNGKKLLGAEAHGKQLLIDFGPTGLIQIHLGIYGKWQFKRERTQLETLPVVGQVRLRLLANRRLAELRGPTVCELISREDSVSLIARLGPDPLRFEAGEVQEQRFIQRVRRSSLSIARLLMDQSVIAGVGNVYRAELLFRAGLNPWLAGNEIAPEVLRELWQDSVQLLSAGLKTGVMVTRDELLGQVVPVADRNFVYRRTELPCRVCGCKIRMKLEAGRKLYWCEVCQS
ncbi:MAG: hypothetical protein RL198_686 [Actinomycetota bacterium]